MRHPLSRKGFASNIDADLALIGDLSALLLRGTVTVHDALYTKRFEPNAGPVQPDRRAAPPLAGAAAAPTLPLRFDVHIDAPSTLRIENNLARMVASADLRLQGTYDRPLLLRQRADRARRRDLRRESIPGHARHDRLRQPARIEPYFDIEAETRVRVRGPERRLPRHAGLHRHAEQDDR